MLETDHSHGTGSPPTREELLDEYARLLSQQTVEELRAAARRWDVPLKATRKASIVRQLAAWLNDPAAIRARIDALDDLGRWVLTYVHLALAPDYGIALDNVVRGMAQQKERMRQEAEDLARPSTRARDESGAAIQERIATLSQQGLLLPFRQGNAVYYTLPRAVRLCLPARPDLFAGQGPTGELAIQETTLGRRVQALYAIWMTLGQGRPGTGKPLSRQAAPPRRPIEDSWDSLRDWNNDADEMSAIASGRYGRGRLSTAAFNWALTVTAPPRRLSDADLEYLRQQTGCTAPEIEFCYVLLEGLGALSGAPGEPVSVHREAMYRFLRSSSPDKVRTLWQVWTASVTWSEMDDVLRAEKLRVRRSLIYPSFKPADLYGEWQAAREAVLRYLGLLDADQWVSADRFLRAVYSVHVDLLHHQTDSMVWRLESLKTGKQFGATFEDWQQSHGQFVLAMLQGPLYWLGLIRLGSHSGQEAVPEAIQLTQAGVFALGRSDTLQQDAFVATETPAAGADEVACSIADNLTIALLPGRTPPELYDLVHAVGDLVEATPDRFVYRITAGKVFCWADAAVNRGNATSSGEAIETLIAALARHCAPPGAQPQVASGWQRMLRMWSSNYGQLHVYENLTLLELADDYALRELLISTSLREHLVYQFSPRLVAIRADAVNHLIEEMEKRGYTPRVN